MGSAAAQSPHIPVLIEPLIRAVSPVEGTWLDGTLGAGGYTRALLEAGAEKVIGVGLASTGPWGGNRPSMAARMSAATRSLSTSVCHTTYCSGSTKASME